MKQLSGHLLAALMLLGLPLAAHGASVIRIADPSLCIDGMETDPDDDEGEPVLAAADGACTLAEPGAPISI